MTIVCFGELLIDFVALERGVTVGEASGFVKAPGGAPANVAVAVSRLGHDSAFVGQVGDDPFGHFLADVLRADAVNVDGLRYSEKARTALAFVSNDAQGDRSFMFYRHPSADMLMTPDDVALDTIDGGAVFHFGSITMINDPVRSATLAAVRHAQKAGKIVSYDPNLRLALWPDAKAARAGMLRGLDYAHIVKISEDEVEFLLGKRQIDDLWRDQTQIIVVTRGADGATLHTRSEEYNHPGFKTDVVDTTGAGDAFVAGLLVRLLEQQVTQELDLPQLPHLDDVLRFANATGALTTTQKGAIPALPTRAQVEQFIAEMADVQD